MSLFCINYSLFKCILEVKCIRALHAAEEPLTTLQSSGSGVRGGVPSGVQDRFSIEIRRSYDPIRVYMAVFYTILKINIGSDVCYTD